MKIKMKIAYSALQAGQPILDFFINAIIKTFVEYTIPNQQGKSLLDDNLYFKWSSVFRGERDRAPVEPYISKIPLKQQEIEIPPKLVLNEITN
jgi:hypothetical protein